RDEGNGRGKGGPAKGAFGVRERRRLRPSIYRWNARDLCAARRDSARTVWRASSESDDCAQLYNLEVAGQTDRRADGAVRDSGGVFPLGVCGSEAASA